MDNSSTVGTEYQTQAASERIGYGLTGQVRITNHFSVDISALYRKAGYQFTDTVTTTTTTILNGVTSSTTATTITHQDVRARFFDFPLTVRYYRGAKRPNGPRWFAEGGGAWRWANGIRTSTDVTDAAGVDTCCSFTPVVPAHRSGIGIANMRTRLQSLYGDAFELNMRNHDPDGVEVSVSVPFVSVPKE